MKHFFPFLLFFAAILFSCNAPVEHTAPAINDRDSVAMMTSYGINTMISDSGVMKYRIIAERWEINENLNPPRWIFRRGLFLEQFDDKFHVEAYIQSDTAYYFTVEKLWHLVGNVSVRTIDGVKFNSQELYWDQKSHELYSNVFSRVVTPLREMQGSYFRSDENMRHYYVSNSKGSFMKSDVSKDNNGENTATTDSIPQPPRRGFTSPHQKSDNY